MVEAFPRFKAAVVQAAPHPFQREKGLQQVAGLMAEVSKLGAELALFPEALIPAYPWGLRFGTRIGGRSPEGRRAFARYWSHALEVPSPATDQLGQAARDAGIYAAVGVIERDRTCGEGTLFCSLLYFSPDGRLLGKHRKLKPTAGERYLWGEGDGSTLTVLDTDLGRLAHLLGELHAPGPDRHVSEGSPDLLGTYRRRTGHLARHHAPCGVRGKVFRTLLQSVRSSR